MGMSLSSTNRVLWLFLTSVVTSNALSVHIPTSDDKLKKTATEFTNISGALGLYHGVIGVIDGWLCTTQQPGDVNNPVNYVSGHYQRYGLNVEAICDANLQGEYFALVSNKIQSRSAVHTLR